MNKKGLILIFLFAVSAMSVLALTNAETNDKVSVTLMYEPKAYVDQGEVWVEIDGRYIDDNMVFGENDLIHFGFFFDVCEISWGSQLLTTGDGWQVDDWFFCPINNASLGANITEVGLYNTTRYAGAFNVMLDDVNMGKAIDMGVGDCTSYQEIEIVLDKGWHYLSVWAAELVSDSNHTVFHWEYAQDAKRFYISDDKEDIPPLMEDAFYNFANVEATAKNSEDLLYQPYNITDFDDWPKPKANIIEGSRYLVQEEFGTETDPILTDINVEFNASDTELVLTMGSYGGVFADITTMGPHHAAWVVNDGAYVHNNLTAELPLVIGQNYVYFLLWGFKPDPWALGYGDASPAIDISLAVSDLWIGPVTKTGPNFGIFISVSILGLVAALYIMRRRK